MLIRFQMTRSTFAHMLREGFQRQDLCVPPLGPDAVIDRIEIPNAGGGLFPTLEAGPPIVLGVPDSNGAITNVPCNSLRLTQGLTVFVAKTVDLTAANGAAAPTQSLPLFPKFTFSFDHQPTGDFLTVSYDSLGPFLAPGIDPTQVDTALRTKFKPVGSQVNLTKALASLGTVPQTVWAGIAASAEFDRVELRLELQAGGGKGSSDIASWQRFYQQQDLDDLVQGDDWALLVDKDLLIAGALGQVKDSVSKDSSFHLVSGPDVSWNPGTPGLNITFNGDALNACQCFWGTQDVNVDISIDVALSVENNQLRQDLHLNHDTNQSELFCCELTAVLFWPVIGAKMVADGHLSLSDFILGIELGPAFIFLGAIATAANKATPFTPGADCTKDPHDENHITCRAALSLNPTPDSCNPNDDVRLLQAVRGVNSGLILAGSYQDRQLKPPIVAANVTQFAWAMPGVNCSGEVVGGFVAQALVEVSRSSGDFDFWFCDAVSVGPNAAEFAPFVSVDFDYCPMGAHVRVNAPSYIADPCSILVTTSGGARLVTFDPMPELTQQMIDDYVRAAKQWRLENCYTKVDDWWKYTHRFNPKWAVDPYVGESPGERLWLVAAGELRPGDSIHLMGPQDQSLAIGHASSAGTLTVSAITDQLTLVREAAGHSSGQPTQAKQYRLSIKQVQLVERSVLELGAPALSIRGDRIDGEATICVVTEEGLQVWTIDRLGGARLNREVQVSGLIGVLADASTFVAWTRDGSVFRLSPRDLAKGGPSAILRVGESDVPRGVSSNVAGQFAIVAGRTVRAAEEGLERLDIHGERFEPLTGHMLGRVTDVSLGRSRRDQLLVTLASGESRLVSVDDSGAVQLTHEFGRRAGVEGMIRVGDWLTQLEDDRTHIRLYATAGTRTL
ncbi:MAG TPA: hypothetical protein VGU71_10945 [Candidatus Dormibacteraeota bacterium]|nr:hypothetical protein [Candidatus Dormibacteraeota bacterium]